MDAVNEETLGRSDEGQKGKNTQKNNQKKPGRDLHKKRGGGGGKQKKKYICKTDDDRHVVGRDPKFIEGVIRAGGRGGRRVDKTHEKEAMPRGKPKGIKKVGNGMLI